MNGNMQIDLQDGTRSISCLFLVLHVENWVLQQVSLCTSFITFNTITFLELQETFLIILTCKNLVAIETSVSDG